MDKTVVNTPGAPAPVGPYSQAIVSGGFVFCSGQIPLDPATGAIPEGEIEVEATRVMENLKAVLEAAGSSLDKVVKTTIFMTDLADFGRVNAVYGSYFQAAPPARSTIQVCALPKGARVEIECVAQLTMHNAQ
jgi:2-iminobutanoate/2-iminopropanoate deaminase